MKFINYLSTIAGIEIYPLISLSIFFLFFLVLILYVSKGMRKETVATMKNIPFQDINNGINE